MNLMEFNLDYWILVFNGCFDIVKLDGKIVIIN